LHQNSLANGTGNFFDGTGNYFCRTGNFRARIGNWTSDQFLGIIYFTPLAAWRRERLHFWLLLGSLIPLGL
jgi:hypothetical protein